MAARFLAVVLAALAFAPASLAASAPTGLHGFLLKADDAEQPTHTFSRTPSFAWDPVPGADRYEFELSTSKSFADNAVVWRDEKVAGPLATVPLTLPWIAGAKYSWYAHVRAVVDGEEGPWSTAWGFNMRASGAPRSLSNGTNPQPGMVRWTPVDGATSYQVVFLFELGQGEHKVIETATTAADLREYYTFHNTYPSAVFWRVRAVRQLEGAPLNKLPVASYGPWSARNRTVEPTISTDPITLQGSISRSGATDIMGTTAFPGAHELTPGFWWSGSRSLAPDLFGDCPLSVAGVIGTGPASSACPLFHVYVFSDADCVNRVHVSDLVGSPAYVPRLTGPLALPDDKKTLDEATGLFLGDDESEGEVFDAGGDKVLPTGIGDETAAPAPVPPAAEGTSGTGDSTGSDSSSGSEGTDAQTIIETRRNGLWDNDWPTSRYYWVVVPAVPRMTPDGEKVEYHDVAFPEDMCAAGQVKTFGKTSAVLTAADSGVPYASGMSSTGTLVAATTATPTFFGKPIVAWKPAPGAQRYEVQWSKKAYPWKTVGKLTTPATSALLELPAGRWYYRVRGLDFTLPGLPGLSWSEVAQVQIMPPTFEVVSKTSALKRKARRR